jgi:hypothetical protein
LAFSAGKKLHNDSPVVMKALTGVNRHAALNGIVRPSLQPVGPMNSFSPLRKIALTIVALLLLFSGLYLQQIARTGAQLRSETTTQATLRARQLTGSVADQIAILVRYIDFASQELAETYVEESASEFAAKAPKIGQRFPRWLPDANRRHRCQGLPELFQSWLQGVTFPR